MTDRGTVIIVDDDPDLRASLQWLLESVGYKVSLYDSAEEFLEAGVFDQPGCMLLDVRMPGLGGIRLLEMLKSHPDGVGIPVIMFTGHGEISMAVKTMKQGAFDFLEKPATPQVIIDTVDAALALDRQNRQRLEDRQATGELLTRLTQREGEVLELLVSGHGSRAISDMLGISERTVEKHRSRLIEKLGVDSTVQLVRMILEYRRLPDA